MRTIRGSGGGGKGGGGSARAAVEAPDSLRSRQYARVLDLVSEGESDGLVNGLQSVYLDDTPVQNADGSLNFAGVTLTTRTGTQSQSYIPGFGGVEAEQAVAVEVTAAIPVVRSVSNPNANSVRVTISVPQLTSQNLENGDLNGTSVKLAVDIQSDGGGFVEQYLSIKYTSAGVTFSNGVATNTIPNDLFQASVSFQPPAPTGIMSRPHGVIGYLIQYRMVGETNWTDYRSGEFDSHSSPDGSSGLLSTFGSSKFGFAKSRSSSGGLSLPYGSYNFRVVKTSGYEDGVDAQGVIFKNTGLQYGGSVSITSLTVSQPQYGDTISGKTTSRYQRSYKFELTGTGPWDIRVRRITADSTASALANATYWDSYTEIIDAKLRYPNSALVALSIDAERFSAIPRRGYEMRGLHVRIPSNYNPTTRAYAGAWDGSFTTAWTNNPAWCFYDLLTSTRYGLGSFINADQVDKWSLYQIARYCDELVPSGFGGSEPRFTCNLYLQTRAEAFSVINSFASIFCGMVYWGAGAIISMQDAPADPVALYTPANVVGGQFGYSGSSVKTRHTVALVSWNDPADRYKQKIEYVEDAQGISIYGIVQTEVVALGCSSRGQAHRYGRRILYTERMETETVTFRTGLDGLAVSPGEIIQTADPVRAGVRMGGRLLAATSDFLTLDSPVTIAVGASYTLWAVLPDGTVESRLVTTGVGATETLSVSPMFSSAPQAMAIWVLAASNLAPETWRVISISEVDNTHAEVAALKYSSGKYMEIEQNIILESLPISSLESGQSAPSDLIISESLYLVTPVVVGSRVTVSWLGTAQYYELQYRRNGENWHVVSTQASSIDIQPAEVGEYEFILRAINAVGRRSLPVSATKIIYGLTKTPGNVSSFNLAAIGGLAHITFDAAADLDVFVGGYLRIRHTDEMSMPEWSSAVNIGKQIPGTATTATLPLLVGTYLAKWVDSGGRESPAAIGIVTDAPNVIELNFVRSLTEQPGFSGVKTRLGLSDLGLTLDSAETIAEQFGVVSTWSKLSTLGGIASSGEYFFDNSIDVGAVYTCRLTAALKTQGFDALDLIGQRPMVSSWASVVGDLITDVDCVIYVRTTNDDPAVSPAWSAWRAFVVGDYYARAFEFKAVLSSDYITHSISVSQLKVTVDMPNRIESGNDIATGTTVFSVVYSLPFIFAPSVGITAQNMQTGDFYEFINKTKTGFEIVFRNSASSIVSRTFDYISRSY